MTEDEAREKWCPMARVDPPRMNLKTIRISGARCIASACMMWRRDVGDDQSYPKDAKPLRYGYCGLAGKP